MVARPSTGLTANTKWIRPRIQYYFAASVVANGVCHLLAPLSTSYVGFCIYAGFFGFAFGWLGSVLFETLMDLIVPQSAVGSLTIVEYCPVLLGRPLLGRLNDIYGDYKYSYWVCGVILIVAGIYLFIGMGINYRLVAKEQKAEEQQKKEGREDEASVDVDEKPKEVTKSALSPQQKKQGVPMFKGGRCLCIGSGVKAVRLANIEKVSIMYPSYNCDRVEVIITLKQHRGQRCLDPRSKQAHLIRQHYEKKNFLKHRNI